MATKAQLQVQIDQLNKQVNDLKNEVISLNNTYQSQVSSAQGWIDGFNRDFAFGGDDCWGADNLSNATVYINANTQITPSFCRKGNNQCSKSGCEGRIQTINQAISAASSTQNTITSKNNLISNLNKQLQDLNMQLLNLPESQAQIQAATAAASANADAEKKKWFIFGTIVLVIIVLGFIVYIKTK